MAILLRGEKKKNKRPLHRGVGDLTGNCHVGTGWVSQRDWKDCSLRVLTTLFGRNMLTRLSVRFSPPSQVIGHIFCLLRLNPSALSLHLCFQILSKKGLEYPIRSVIGRSDYYSFFKISTIIASSSASVSLPRSLTHVPLRVTFASPIIFSFGINPFTSIFSCPPISIRYLSPANV